MAKKEKKSALEKIADTSNELIEKVKKKVKVPKTVVDERYQKISLFFVIVNRGQGESVINLFRELGTSVQFTQVGVGTANTQVLEILGMEDNEKDVVYSFVRENLIEDVTMELEAFFRMHKKNRGIGFSINLNSLVGVKMYHFLTNTL